MAEWHVPPDYIINNWTDELLHLMTEKMADRKERETRAISQLHIGHSGVHKVPDKSLFAQAKNIIKVVKK